MKYFTLNLFDEGYYEEGEKLSVDLMSSRKAKPGTEGSHLSPFTKLNVR